MAIAVVYALIIGIKLGLEPTQKGVTVLLLLVIQHNVDRMVAWAGDIALGYSFGAVGIRLATADILERI
jgi:hypothetical protein